MSDPTSEDRIPESEFLTPGPDSIQFSASQWMEWIGDTFKEKYVRDRRQRLGVLLSSLCQGARWVTAFAQRDLLGGQESIVGFPDPDELPSMQQRIFVHPSEDGSDRRIFVGIDRLVREAISDPQEHHEGTHGFGDGVTFYGTPMQCMELLGVEERCHLATGSMDGYISYDAARCTAEYQSSSAEFEAARLQLIYALREDSNFDQRTVDILRSNLSEAYRWRVERSNLIAVVVDGQPIYRMCGRKPR